jgi:hypothetical protein
VYALIIVFELNNLCSSQSFFSNDVYFWHLESSNQTNINQNMYISLWSLFFLRSTSSIIREIRLSFASLLSRKNDFDSNAFFSARFTYWNIVSVLWKTRLLHLHKRFWNWASFESSLSHKSRSISIVDVSHRFYSIKAFDNDSRFITFIVIENLYEIASYLLKRSNENVLTTMRSRCVAINSIHVSIFMFFINSWSFRISTYHDNIIRLIEMIDSFISCDNVDSVTRISSRRSSTFVHDVLKFFTFCLVNIKSIILWTHSFIVNFLIVTRSHHDVKYLCISDSMMMQLLTFSSFSDKEFWIIFASRSIVSKNEIFWLIWRNAVLSLDFAYLM